LVLSDATPAYLTLYVVRDCAFCAALINPRFFRSISLS
jgi:hypothetical protein